MGNTIGQANAVSDKLLDLRKCTFDGKSLAGRTLSGALMVGASFKGADMTEVVMSKAYAVDGAQCAWRPGTVAQSAPRLTPAGASANFDGATFKNSVLDRVIFNGSSLKGAIFQNAGASRARTA